jgi:NAD(P)-dependent dehydrogenase (short-subunit alcohol dehydrogenase family)
MIDIGLHCRIVLVSGATRGVGCAAARLFAATGAWVGVNYRADLHGAKVLVDTIRSAGGRALLAPGDVRTAAGAWTVARYVEHEWGQIDVLLHAAAPLGSDESAADATPLLAELAPGMRARGWGRVVILGRAGTTMTGRELAVQWGAPGLLVNVLLCPTDQQPERLDEALARAMLFLGSAWNIGVTGATLDVPVTLVDQQIP